VCVFVCVPVCICVCVCVYVSAHKIYLDDLEMATFGCEQQTAVTVFVDNHKERAVELLQLHMSQSPGCVCAWL